jgi:hypothetical protein
VPPYLYEIVDGALPPGFAIDDHTGTITGTGAATGQYSLTVRVKDAALAGASQDEVTLDIRIVEPDFDATCNGSVNGDDVLAVLNDITGLGAGPQVAGICTGDNDGTPGRTLADAMGIQRRIAGLDP